MNKNEMIEELEKEQPIAMIIQRYLDNNNIKVSHPLLPMHIEEMLTRKNYLKIADDEIVLKKSEYEELESYKCKAYAMAQEQEQYCSEGYLDGYERGLKQANEEAEYWKSRCQEIGDVASRETAREILKVLVVMGYHTFKEWGVIDEIDFVNLINSLANKYGIELE